MEYFVCLANANFYQVTKQYCFSGHTSLSKNSNRCTGISIVSTPCQFLCINPHVNYTWDEIGTYPPNSPVNKDSQNYHLPSLSLGISSLLTAVGGLLMLAGERVGVVTSSKEGTMILGFFTQSFYCINTLLDICTTLHYCAMCIPFLNK